MVRFRLTITAAMLAAAFAASANADPVLEVSGGAAAYAGGFNYTAGWSFTTNTAISVTALDAYDPSGTGLVQLYDGNSHVIASATVTNSDPAEGSPTSFFSEAITPVTLAADTTYYIAQDMTASLTSFLVLTGTPTTSALITYGSSVSGDGLGATPTTDAENAGVLNPAYFGPDFDATAVVPEPASLTVLGFGLAGLGFARRRRRG